MEGRGVATTPLTNARRSERKAQNIEITLLGKMQGVEYLQPARTQNVSSHGLGILTEGPVEPSRPFNPGQIVYVYGAGDFRLGYCRVVWVRNESLELPTRAGLEFLN